VTIRRALITGVSGQDGSYLAEHLYARGVEVWGVTRDGLLAPELAFVRPTPAADVRDLDALAAAVSAAAPDAVFHLAAQSSVGSSWNNPAATATVTGAGTARLLEAVRRVAPAARVFVASSSEIFGRPDRSPQDESTPIRPASPYGAAKAFAHHLVDTYRKGFGMFVVAGILYNHESPRRGPQFVTRKIVKGAVAIAAGQEQTLPLGNLEARRDWGFAGDYVRAMALMLDHPEPEDFVIASGETHSVGDWCESAFRAVGLDWRDHVVVDPDLWRPVDPGDLVGDASKAARLLGWRPETSFDELVRMMVEAEQAALAGVQR